MTKETSEIECTSVGIADVGQQHASSIQSRLPLNSPLSRHCCIFRVPITLRRRKKYVFAPRLVSIGPFHSGKQQGSKEMERVKEWYLSCLLRRSETSLYDFVKTIGKMETYCRGCYAEEINLRSDRFIYMMVLDGCFIIELFQRFDLNCVGTLNSEDDPIFSVGWMFSPLAHDLLLLENQLPWKVLECLWNLTTPDIENGNVSLHSLALNFFQKVLVLPEDTSNELEGGERHLLDFLRNILLGPCLNSVPTSETCGGPIPCATDLWRAGIKFKRLEPTDFPFIGFDEGQVCIPRISVYDNSEILFKNVIAFEQCDPGSTNIITSYAAVLCDLINSTRDVDLLTRKGIVISFLSTEDTLRFFRSLPNGAVINRNFFGSFYGNVNSFFGKRRSKCKGKWNKYIGILKRDYFNSPWSIIKFLAAASIVAFTLLQTLLAIFAHWGSHNRPNN